jgi:putative FmdB family regulatory protein
MPVYEYECGSCGNRFDELVEVGGAPPPCPECGAAESRRRYTAPAPPGRVPRGARVRDADARRAERAAARGERLAETKKKRAKGEMP